MLLDELFDLDAISKAGVSFVQLHQLRKQWDGQLDVLLYFREEKFPAVGDACVLNLLRIAVVLWSSINKMGLGDTSRVECRQGQGLPGATVRV